jgi:hypothetical protein
MRLFYAIMQISPNGINWTDIDTQQLVYENFLKTDIPRALFYNTQVSLIKYNFIPPVEVENTYIRVVIRMVPNNTVGRFSDNAFVTVNGNPSAGQPNSYFAIYPTVAAVSGVARYNLNMRGNGWAPGGINGIGYYTRQAPAPGSADKPDPVLNGLPILPAIIGNRFYVVPFVINNDQPSGNSTLTNARLITRPNNFRHYYGPSLIEFQNLTPLTTYSIYQRFNVQLTNTVADVISLRIYVNGAGINPIETIVVPSANATIDLNYLWSIPSLAVNSYLFMTMSWTQAENDGMTVRYLDDNSFSFGV